MTNRKDGKPKKKGGFHKYPLVFEPKEKTENDSYENEEKAKRKQNYLKKLRNKMFR